METYRSLHWNIEILNTKQNNIQNKEYIKPKELKL